MTSAVGNYLLRNNDIELLRAFPATTSPANAASAISRAIYTSLNGNISGDVQDEAKRTLASMNTKPSHESLAGLVEAASHGVGARDLGTFVLSSGVWRALLALLPLKIKSETMLHIIQLAVSSTAPLVIPGDSKFIRISKFYLSIAIKFTQALAEDTTPDSKTTKAFFVLYHKILRLKLLQEYHKMLIVLLKATFRKIPVTSWRSTFVSSNPKEEEAAFASIQVALYFVRCAVTNCGGSDDDLEWKKKCEHSLPTEMLPYLFDSFASFKPSSLVEKKVNGASILSVVTASIVNTSLYMDMHHGGAVEILLCKVSSPCIISSLVASFALVELAKYRNTAGRKGILELVRHCLDLSRAVHSLHANQRWEPLMQRIERGKTSLAMLPIANLSSACTLPVLQRARAVHTLKSISANPKLRSDVRAGALVCSGLVSQAIHAIVRAALDDERTNQDMKEHLTLLSKHLPSL